MMIMQERGSEQNWSWLQKWISRGRPKIATTLWYLLSFFLFSFHSFGCNFIRIVDIFKLNISTQSNRIFRIQECLRTCAWDWSSSRPDWSGRTQRFNMAKLSTSAWIEALRLWASRTDLARTCGSSLGFGAKHVLFGEQTRILTSRWTGGPTLLNNVIHRWHLRN